MCGFISWIEHDGKNWYLTNKELNSDKGKELLEYCGRAEDLVGHGAIRQYYDFDGGFDKGCTDFTDPSMLPTEIVKALKDGLFEGIGLPWGILTSEARAEYDKGTQQAQAEYDKIEQPAHVEYEKIRQQAWAEYIKITQPTQAESERYGKIRLPAWAEYVKIQQPAWDKCEKITQPAFWNLFKEPNNRIEAWR